MRPTILALLVCALLTAPRVSAQDQKLFSPDQSRYDLGQQVIYRIYTESDPPRSFKNSSGKITGSAVDVMQELLNRLNRVEPIDMRSWEESYGFLKQGPNTILFSVAKTKDREPLFGWVGPISQSKLQLFALSGSAAAAQKDPAAWKNAKVVTVQGWYSETYLREQGYGNIIAMKNPTLALQKLLDGTGDYLCLPELSTAGAVLFNHTDNNQLAKVSSLETVPLYIAFSGDVPGDVLKKWQATLDQMTKDGFISRNQQKWVNIYKKAVETK